MRRNDREITKPEVISQVIRNAQVCRLGLAKDNVPYILPVSFGYDGEAVYFHTAREGRKIDFIQANNRVCFEFEHGVKLLPNAYSPCDWSFSYQSVIGEGVVHELLSDAEKTTGLDHIMGQYSDREWEYPPNRLANIRVWKITIEKISGKESKDKAAV